MKKGLGIILTVAMFNFWATDFARGVLVYDAMNAALNSSQLATQEAQLLTQQTQLATQQATATKQEANFIQQFVQGSHTLQAVVTGAQWAQSTVKGIQDQLSFFNDVRNYIESVEGAIQSVTDMYDTVANAYQDIDKTKTRWNKLMKGNYNDIKGIKEGLSEAASLADNLDDHAAQLEQDAINVSQKARMHDKALDAMLRKAKEMVRDSKKAADPTVALYHGLQLQATVEQQRIWNEVYLREALKGLQEERKRVKSGKREKETFKNISEGFGKIKPSLIEYIN